VRIQVRVSEEVFEQVQAIAQGAGTTCGHVAAEAIEFYLKSRANADDLALVARVITVAELTKKGDLIVMFANGLPLRMPAREVAEWFGSGVTGCRIVDEGRGIQLIRKDGTPHGYDADFLGDLSKPSVRKKSDEESAQRKMAVSHQVRAARRRMSISAKRLAHASGVPFATIKATERCEIEVDRKTLAALADALGVSVDELDLEELP
jgi:DNA-binding transcriptional regulator YiaG